MGADWSFGLTHNGRILPLVRTTVNLKSVLLTMPFAPAQLIAAFSNLLNTGPS
jgi:hypothetical protein